MSQSEELEPSVNSAVYLQQIVDQNKHKFSVNDEEATIYSGNIDPDEARRWKNFKMYSLYNTIRFVIIAACVCGGNFMNQNQIDENSPDCCNCYYIAMNSELYGIDTKYRIDWSYCMPQCVDCVYCKEHANASFQTTSCPAQGYTPTHVKFKLDWDKHCPEQLSMTSIKFFLKNYKVYGVSTVILVILYIFLMVAFVFCCKSYAGINSGASLLVYNVIVSINIVYSMFKPMQYYHKHITQNIPTPSGIICEVDTLDETTEDLLTYCVIASFIFIVLQWMMGVIGCLITRKAMDNKRGSGMLPWKIKLAYIRFEKLMIVVAVVLGIVFYIALLYASGIMIEKRIAEDRGKKDAWKIGAILIVDVLAIGSCFDIFCFPFCQHTCRNYCGQTKNKAEHQTYLQLLGASFDQGNQMGVPLMTDDEKEKES